MHVVPAGGVLEQVDDADGICSLPGVSVPDVGRVLTERIVQRELALFLQLEYGERREALCDGADAEERVGSSRAVLRRVGHPDAVGEQHAVAGHHRETGARNVAFAEGLFDSGFQFINGLRSGVVSSPARSPQQRQKDPQPRPWPSSRLGV